MRYEVQVCWGCSCGGERVGGEELRGGLDGGAEIRRAGCAERGLADGCSGLCLIPKWGRLNGNGRLER